MDTISRAELTEIVEQWLADIRERREVSAPAGRGLEQLRTATNAPYAIHALLESARELLPADSAELLTLYFWEAHTIQAIKNNRQRAESVATLWRRLKGAVSQLVAAIHAAERDAARRWQRQLRERLPQPQYERLYGREATIEDVVAQLREPALWLYNLVGLGGLGKAALAHAVIKRMFGNGEIDDLVWITVEASAESLTDQILNRLFTTLAEKDPAALTSRQRFSHLKTILSRRIVVVVIDNIETFDDDGSLALTLHQLANPSRFLVASRTRLIAERPLRYIPLSEIDKEQMCALVRARAAALGVQELTKLERTSLVERLWRTVGGHPLALRLLVQLAVYFPAENILAEFESAGIHDVDTLYATIYERIWSQQSDHARQLLDAMQIVAPDGAAADYLEQFCGLDKAHLWRAIRELYNAALLDRIGQSMTYRMHSLTASFLATRPRDGKEQTRRCEQIVAACTYWLQQADDDDIIAHCNGHLTTLMRHALPHADCWRPAVEVMLATYFQVDRSFHWQTWMSLYQLALDHALDSERTLQYRLYSRLATLQRRTGNYQRAAEMNQHALHLADALGDLKGVGREHVHLSISKRYLHRYREAAEHAQTALDIFEELRLGPHFYAVALNSLGQNAMEAANFAQADRYFARAADFASSAEATTANALILTNWGDVLRLLGDDAAAHDKYDRAHGMTAQLDNLNTLLLAYSRCNILLDQRRLDEAAQIVRSPSFRYDAIGTPVLHAAHIAVTVGRYHYMRGEYDEAIMHLEAAVSFWEQTPLERALGIAKALLAAAYRSAEQGEQGAALQAEVATIFEGALAPWYAIYDERYGFINKNGVREPRFSHAGGS